jgi:hypothetical protein
MPTAGRLVAVALMHAKLPELAAEIADRPRARTASIYDRCKVYWAARPRCAKTDAAKIIGA